MGVYKEKDEKNKPWYYRFHHKGKRYQKRRFRTKGEAAEAERVRREELVNPKFMTRSVSFHELSTQHLQHVLAKHKYNTFRYKQKSLGLFIEYVGGETMVNEIERHEITSYLDDMALDEGPKRANRDLRDIKRCINWGIEERIIDCFNPCVGIPIYVEERYIPYIPPQGDIVKVLLQANKDQQDFIYLIIQFLARRGELARLLWGDINFQRRVAVFHITKRRGFGVTQKGKPISSIAMKILKRRYENRDIEKPTVFDFTLYGLRYLERLCQKAGVKPFGFHALRHRAASLVNDTGKHSMKEIQLLLAHEKQTTTEEYLHHISSTLFDALSVLEDDHRELENVEDILGDTSKKNLRFLQ